MPTGTFAASAVIAARHFTLDAVIVGSYLRHLRGGSQHTGTQDTTTVVLSAAIGQYAAGTTVQDVLSSMIGRLVTLESANIIVGTFRVDAFIQPRFWADAVLKRTQSASYTANAVITLAVPRTFTADAQIASPASASHSFSARAFIV